MTHDDPLPARLDLNLFRCFAMIYQERNLTRAADRLCISQSAVSHALARMREQLGDPLFVRESQGMLPTPLARQIWPDVEQGLQALHRATQRRDDFDPARDIEQITIAMNDEVEPTLLPLLMARLRRDGLHMRIASVRLDRSTLRADLATGRLDCVIDVAQAADDQLLHVPLTRDEFVVVSRRKRPLDAQAYIDAEHITVSSRRTGRSYEDIELARQGIHRRVTTRCQHYQSAWQLVAASDALLTMPRSLAESASSLVPNHIQELPIAIAPVELHFFWHRDRDSNPSTQWLKAFWLNVVEP